MQLVLHVGKTGRRKRRRKLRKMGPEMGRRRGKKVKKCLVRNIGRFRMEVKRGNGDLR